MVDAEKILIDNLTEALKRSDRYLSLGVVADASVLMLTVLPADAAKSVALPVAGLPLVPRSAAVSLPLR